MISSCEDTMTMTYYDHFLKDSLTVGVFATVANVMFFFPREVTGHHRGSTDVEAVKMLSKPAFACRGIESQICLETQ